MVFLRVWREGPGGGPAAGQRGGQFLAGATLGLSTRGTNAHSMGLVVSVQFASADAAIRFERFLKSSSGRAFAKHYFE